MRFNLFLFALPLVLASPLLNSSEISAAPPTTEDVAPLPRWIITLKNGFLLDDVLDRILSGFGVGRSRVVYTYDMPGYQGFVIQLPSPFEDIVPPIPSLSSIIKWAERDSIVKISAVNTQINAPYGLARLSRRANAAGTVYKYDATAGTGAFAYVVDTVRYPDAYCICVRLKSETSDHLI